MKTVRNVTALEQLVLVDGRQEYLRPHEEKAVPDLVAEAFLQDCPGLVVESRPDAIGMAYDKPIEKPETVWLANMLGDPDAPEKVRVKRYNTQIKRYEVVEIENQFRHPRAVVREHGGPMEEYQGKEGLMARNKPSTFIGIPPYQRRELPAHIARWFIGRDQSIQPPEFRNQVCVSRPRSPNEPDMTWDLDDMRAYLRLMDRRVDIGPSIKDLKAENPEKPQLELAIYDAKLLCMKRLHFRCAKASARLYSRSEFEEFRRGFEKPIPAVSADAAAASVAKSLAATSKLAPGITGDSPLSQ